MTPVAFLYGHYACPHTFIAKGRLALLASEAPLSIVWRPLPPPAGHTGAADWATLAGPDDSVAEVIQALRRDAAGLGLTLTLPPTPPNPRLAHVAAEFARDCGPAEFERLNASLFRAVFIEGSDIEDEAVLLRLGQAAGLDAEGLSAAIEDERYDTALAEVEAEAERYGIDATPTILMGKYKLVGAAPLDVLRETRDKAEQDVAGGEQA